MKGDGCKNMAKMMKLGQFIDEYCQDIIDQKNVRQSYLGKDDGLPCDEIVEDDSGQMMKVVYSATRRIPVMDILEMDRNEFAKVYSSESDLETYDRYCDAFIILEGEEALDAMRWLGLESLRLPTVITCNRVWIHD